MHERTLIERLTAAVAAMNEPHRDGDAISPGLAEKLAAVEQLAAELPDLAARLDRLAELEDHFNEAVEIAKLDALKELAYGASHELNNPLANISARAQTLLQEEKDPERRRRLAAINSQAFRAHEMIADMMLFARPPQLVPQTRESCRIARRSGSSLTEEASQQNTELVRVGGDTPIEARVDPVHLRAALRALVINSLEALAEGGRIELSVRRGSNAARSARSADSSTVEIARFRQRPGNLRRGPATFIRPVLFRP